MNIDPIRSISLVKEVRKALKVLIANLLDQDKTKLPGEHALAEMLGVSRITLRDVLKEFQQDGLIYKIQGKGTFINKNAKRMKVTLNPAVEFGQAINSCGYESKVALVGVSLIEAGEWEATELRVTPGDQLVKVRKIFYADDIPVIYCVDIFPRSFVKEELVSEDLLESTFEYLLEIAGITVINDIVNIKACVSSAIPEYREHSKCDGNKPMLLLESLYFTAKNRPVLLVEAYMDTDFIKLSMIRRQDVYAEE